MAEVLQHTFEHVLKHLNRHREESKGEPTQPLFVGVQGPQGSGKTFLTSQLKDLLESRSISVAVLSLDDLYLPHDGLLALASQHPHNTLLQGRGQPGTHDILLGTKVLNGLRGINETGAPSVTLPVFDKSLHGGEGDRLSNGVVVKGPIDIAILEGWCMGFGPTTIESIQNKWIQPVKGLEGKLEMKEWRVESIIEINEMLKQYLEWWAFFRVFVQIKPVDDSPYEVIYKWRLEQEHYMKAHNGGKGMTDEQVKRFVDRYIPGYVFFGQGVIEGSPDQRYPAWIGNGLTITIGEQREILHVVTF